MAKDDDVLKGFSDLGKAGQRAADKADITGGVLKGIENAAKDVVSKMDFAERSLGIDTAFGKDIIGRADVIGKSLGIDTAFGKDIIGRADVIGKSLGIDTALGKDIIGKADIIGKSLGIDTTLGKDIMGKADIIGKSLGIETALGIDRFGENQLHESLAKMAQPKGISAILEKSQALKGIVAFDHEVNRWGLSSFTDKVAGSHKALLGIDTEAMFPLSRDLRTWRNLTAPWDSPLKTKVASSVLGWSSAVSKLATAASESSALVATFGALERPAHAFTTFAALTHRRMDRTGDELSRVRLAASVEVAERQLKTHAGLIADLLPFMGTDEATRSRTRLKLPYQQQREFLDDPGDETDSEVLATRAPSAAVHSLSRDALRLMLRCIEADNANNRPATFATTTKVLSAFVDLPLIDAANEVALGELVDHLFFMLYEGAGSRDLRFLADHGGPLSASQCDVIWDIKTLRNKWLRHDVEHGSATDIKRSFAKRQAAFASLGLERQPREPAEFRAIQERLLRRVVNFLTAFLEAVEKFPAPK